MTIKILQEAEFEPSNLEYQTEFLISNYKDLYKIDGRRKKNVQAYSNITSHRIIPRSYMDIDFNSAVNGIKVGELFWLFGGINLGLGLGTHSVG